MWIKFSLIFLRPDLSEHKNYFIYPDWHLISDYTLLTINIAIFEENIQTKKHTIVKNSKEENKLFSKCSLIVQKKFGINIWKLLILLNTPKHGEMKTVVEIWGIIDRPRELKTGNDSRV